MNLFLNNLRLALELAYRELSIKYKRSTLGWLWLVLTPLSLLAIYSVIFGRVFGIEWQETLASETRSVGFTLPFFVGLTLYLLVSDVVNSSTVLYVSKRTYVIKSPFPLWVLWLANFIRAWIQASLSFFLLIVVALIQQRLTLIGLAWMGVALINIILFLTGLSLFLSALGPFIGDISEGVRLILRVLFYAAPITYPLSLIEPRFRDWMWCNPLTGLIEPLRSAIVFGEAPPIGHFLGFGATSVLLMGLAVWVFGRVKGVISDVV
jgi:lipopolysaccharide transport system permease protein